MKRRFSTLSTLTVLLAVGITGSATASTTLGTTTMPSGAALSNCSTDRVIAQATSDPSTPYSVPASGTITQWQTNTDTSVPGSPVMLVVLRPAGTGFVVIGVDARTLPNPAPSSHVASYVLPSPIAVAKGDTLGLYTGSINVICYWSGGSTPLGNSLAALVALTPPAPNQALIRAGGDSPGGYMLNLSATFEPPAAPAPAPAKKKCKKKHKRSAESAKRKCKKKKKR